jgi:prepilin-type N-terminal cleavage/methylation domain-containing protein
MEGRARQAGVTLIELLVVILIASIVSGALLLTWFSLNDSYSFTTRSSKAQDFARDAVARMGRELRDAEPKGGDLAVLYADSDEIRFTTTFNEQGNESRQVEPVLTRYYYQWDDARSVGELHRVRGESDRIVVDNLLNPLGPDGDGSADIFRYAYVSTNGDYVPAAQTPEPDMYGTISLIRIHLSVDLNPESAPQPMKVSTTVHLRNQNIY